MQDNSVLRSVTSSQVSVAFLDDSVSSGSTISATLAPATPSVSLSILNASPNLAVSLINNNDGTYTTLLNTPGIAGEYIVSLFSENAPSIDGNPDEISSIYIYSDGNNDCASCVSMDEAHGKYYMNYVASETDKVLLGKEEQTDGFTSTKTRYAAEQDYANATYDGGDIETQWSVSSANNSGKVKVTGNATWYDENEVSHPLVGVKAILWDDDIFWNEYCGSTYTDSDGYFSFEISNQIFFELGGRDLFVALYSETDAVLVESFWWGEYIMMTPLFTNVFSNSQIEFDIAIHPGVSDRANAFEITQAENIPHKYIKDMDNTDLPMVPIFYPAFDGEGCYYNNVLDYLAIGWKFYRDWDCLNHEYGHFINDQLDLCDDSVGGDHYVGEDLVSSKGKTNGLKMAMSEGLASYLGTAAQMYCGTDLGVPRVGDEIYHAVNGVNENYGLYRYGQGFGVGGEGNEFSVTSLLIKLLDGEIRANDSVALGHSAMWSAIKSSNHWCISSLISTIISAHEEQRSAIGLILENEGFAPIPSGSGNTSLVTNSNNPCWTFSWDVNGFDSVDPDLFDLVFEGLDNSTFTLGGLTTTSVSLTATQANSVLDLPGNLVRWHVVGYNSGSPTTGEYSSSDLVSNGPSSSTLIKDVSKASNLSEGEIEWFRFTAPYASTFYFESSGGIDMYGEIFPDFVADGTLSGRLAYNDDGGVGLNYKIAISLTSGQTVYLRSRAYNASASDSYSILVTSDHVHDYSDHYDQYSSTQHKSCCSCGAYVLQPHISNGIVTWVGMHKYTNCALCGQLIDLNTTPIIVGP